jgi:hypothetical protein
MEWLMFAEGAVVGGLTIIATIVIAWRQRVIQLRDRTGERELERQRVEHQNKIEGRAKWQPEYDEIRQCLDYGETLAYRVLDTGPCSTSELDDLGLTTLAIKCKILAERGIERLRNPLLKLADLTADLRRHAVAEGDFTTVGAYSHGSNDPRKNLLRAAVAQDRAAREIADQIKFARRMLREEWGD